jgi:hypothetical protein
METTCPICERPLDDLYAVSCMACGRRVHFRSAESGGESCSRIVSQLCLCGLAFLCNSCQGEAEATS